MTHGNRLARLTSTVVLLGIGIAMIAACSGTPPLPPRAPGEPPPEIVVATESDEEPLASCGRGTTFPAAVVEESIGPDDQLPPEFEGLNEILRVLRGEFRLPDDTIWRLAFQDAESAIFLTQQAGGWIVATVSAEGNGWRATSMGGCRLRLVVSEQPGTAQWRVDDRVPPPSADSVELQVMVQDAGCSSGTYATGRIASPVVSYSADAVVISAAVREIPGGTCLRSPATPAVFVLPEPIGDRQLLDGYHVPPAPPREPEW